MDPFIVLIVVCAIHCALFFLDTLFKDFRLEHLELDGLRQHLIGFIQKCGSWRPKLVDLWFNFGMRCSLVLLPVAMIIAIKTALNAWQETSGTGDVSSTIKLEAMIPGINLPMSDIGYYLTTLIVCSVVHEFGHAVAAVREDIHISGIGLIIVFILPVAYVHITTEQFESLPPKRQLLIMCAGVWHNIVLAVLAILVLTGLPVLLYPFFEVGNGVIIRNIQQASPLLGPTGLQTENKILALNQCQVKDHDSWYGCILSAVNHASPGYCVSSELVREHDESAPVRHMPGFIECCNPNSPDHLCFEFLDKEGNMAELPQHSCLPGRIVIESTDEMCVTGSDCSEGLHCLKPSLDNHTRLLRIKRANEKMVIFLGHPAEVYHTVEISDFVPSYFFIPSIIPEIITRMCKYISVFSAGLAIINIIPCLYLDGQYIIHAVSDILLADKVQHRSVRHAVALCITVCGTIFVFGNLVSILLSAVL